MQKYKHQVKWLALGIVAVILSACGSTSESEQVKTVTAMQRKDKNLSCKEVLLEMNEADFYKRMAEKNRGPKLKNIIMPLGYISTYMDSEEAIEAANARVSYLDRIYDILRCEDADISPQPVDSMGEYYNPAAASSVIPQSAQATYPEQQPAVQQQPNVPVYPQH